MTDTAFPKEYPELVFRSFDFSHSDQIALDDLPLVLSALGYDPDATLSVATTLMCDDDAAGASSTKTPVINDQTAGTIAFNTAMTRTPRLAASFVRLSKFLEGIEALHEMRGGRADSIASSFRLFDVQRRGVVSVEDMLATVCVGGNGALTAEECKQVVQALRGSDTIKGLTIRDFRAYLGS